mgnify:CR=1 FL=1
MLIHQSGKPFIMSRFQHMYQLMHHDIFQTFTGLLGQFGIQADRFGSWVTTAPFCFHATHKKPVNPDTDSFFPFGQQGRYCLLNQPAIPTIHYFLIFSSVTAIAYLENQTAVFQLNPWRGISLNNLHQITLTPYIVTFPVQILPWGFPVLSDQYFLLRPNPTHFRNQKETKRIQLHMGGCRKRHPARGRMYAEMDVFNILSDNVHSNVSDLYPGFHQYSSCNEMIEKIRSTSSALLSSKGNKADLIALSLITLPRQP